MYYSETSDTILFLDALFDFLAVKNMNISEESITKLAKYIESEQFDTDSLKMDLHEAYENGNIVSIVKNNNIIIKIMTFIDSNKSMYMLHLTMIFYS